MESRDLQKVLCRVTHIKSFFLISPIKNKPTVLPFEERAVKQKRCGNSYFKFSVRTKTCGGGSYQNNLPGPSRIACILHLTCRQVAIFGAVLSQLATVKKCGMVRETIMHAQDGAPSQPHLWMIWYPGTELHLECRERACLRGIQSFQALRWPQDNSGFLKSSLFIFKWRKA